MNASGEVRGPANRSVLGLEGLVGTLMYSSCLLISSF